MSYTNLPPGRNRMLAYSNYLETRRRYNRIVLSPITTFRYSIIRRDEGISLNYDTLSRLEDVKIGLINKRMVLNTKVSLNKDKELFCVICQEKVEENKIIRSLKCAHSFDLECIDKWLVNNKNCPACKDDV
jgi:hypothetical protein